MSDHRLFVAWGGGTLRTSDDSKVDVTRTSVNAVTTAMRTGAMGVAGEIEMGEMIAVTETMGVTGGKVIAHPSLDPTASQFQLVLHLQLTVKHFGGYCEIIWRLLRTKQRQTLRRLPPLLPNPARENSLLWQGSGGPEPERLCDV